MDFLALICDYRLLNAIFDAAWRAIRAAGLPPGYAPSAALDLVGDIHRSVGVAWRADHESVRFRSRLSAHRRSLVAGEVTRLLAVLPALKEVGGLEAVPGDVLAHLQSLLDTGVAEAAATQLLEAGLPTGPSTVPQATMVPGIDVDLMIRVHEAVTRMLSDAWTLMAEGKMSRHLINTDEHERNFIAITTTMWQSISEAVRAGEQVTTLRVTMRAEQLLFALDVIEKRLALLPFAGEFGMETPPDPEAIGAAQDLIRRTREAFASGS